MIQDPLGAADKAKVMRCHPRRGVLKGCYERSTEGGTAGESGGLQIGHWQIMRKYS